MEEWPRAIPRGWERVCCTLASPRRVGVAGSGTTVECFVQMWRIMGKMLEYLHISLAGCVLPRWQILFFPLEDTKVELGCYFYFSVPFGR